MAQQSEFDRLQTAWRALAGDGVTEGWRTIPIEPLGAHRLLAGRHFPGNEEAILVGFNSVHLPPDGQLPQGQGFRVERVRHKISGDAHAWIALSRQPVGSLDMFARMAEDVVGMLEITDMSKTRRSSSSFLAASRRGRNSCTRQEPRSLVQRQKPVWSANCAFLNRYWKEGCRQRRPLTAGTGR